MLQNQINEHKTYLGAQMSVMFCTLRLLFQWNTLHIEISYSNMTKCSVHDMLCVCMCVFDVGVNRFVCMSVDMWLLYLRSSEHPFNHRPV